MKRGNLGRWTNINGCKNLLFFSELVNELLFDYSIPSNRISTLNSHFLCYDALNAIHGIDKNGVPEGTLKPIMEELYASLEKDPVFEREDHPLRYFVKYQNEKYRISTSVSELSYEELKNTTYTINSRFFFDNNYYKLLMEAVKAAVIGNDESEQPKLLRLVKSLITEIVNLGYSVKYIQDIMTALFWNPQKQVDTPERINEFFEAFDFTRKEYTVVFVVNKLKISKLVNAYEDLELIEVLQPQTPRRAEKRFLNKHPYNAFLPIKRNAYDQYSAAEAARQLLDVNSSFYRLFDHAYRYSIDGAKCGVYGNGDFYLVEREISGVSHTKTPSNKQLEESMGELERAIKYIGTKNNANDFSALIHAALFHAQSLDSKSSENQLLDMWAIIEAVLNISNKHTSDRINQVCMYLLPILKRGYLYSLFLQLFNDIKNYSEELLEEIVGAESEEAAIVQRICEFVLLTENEEDRNAFLQKCVDFPLLKERVQYYSETLTDSQAVYRFVEKHTERVKWQVMRIYRNRNLIIHNGKKMPYLDLLIENLHAYIDVFFDYVINEMAQGHTIKSMCQILFAEECEWVTTFSQKKRPLDKDLIVKMLA